MRGATVRSTGVSEREDMPVAISWCDGDGDHGVWGSAAWVARDQFAHFVTLAHQHGEPSNWSSFRLELVGALNAAWGFDTRWGGPHGSPERLGR